MLDLGLEASIDLSFVMVDAEVLVEAASEEVTAVILESVLGREGMISMSRRRGCT